LSFSWAIFAVKIRADTGDAQMGYSEIIAREAETLPPEKQIQILDFIAFLKARHVPIELTSTPKTAEEIETFFRNFKVDTSGYKFDRDDANAR
jgi:hypothetical protein